jgi:hypothetical protein
MMLMPRSTKDAALDAAIGCVRGDWRTCEEYPWHFCCAARLRAVKVAPQPTRQSWRRGANPAMIRQRSHDAPRSDT